MNRFDDLVTGKATKVPADNLENNFLIAMPHLHDPYFSNTVTYLWKHSEEGALGIVVNKPSRMRVTELLKELRMSIDSTEQRDKLYAERVLSGGPVEKHKGFILHDAEREWEYTLPLNAEVNLSMSRDILADIAAGKGPEKYLISLGCAGWEAGQLEQEISNNIWLTVPADVDLLFSHDFDNKASAVAALLGVSLSQLASLAGHS
jgi:putative transcriptional regulator